MRIYKVDICGILEEGASSLCSFFTSKAEAEKAIRQFLKEDFLEVKENGENDLEQAIADGVIDDPVERRIKLSCLQQKKFEPSMIQPLDFKNTKAGIIWLLRNHGGSLRDVE